jgi:hypothetical protein
MRFLVNWVTKCWMLVVPLLTIILVATALHLLGYKEVASSVSNYGTALTVLVVLIYVVAIDSRKRWPNTNWFQRAVNIITFTR